MSGRALAAHSISLDGIQWVDLAPKTYPGHYWSVDIHDPRHPDVPWAALRVTVRHLDPGWSWEVSHVHPAGPRELILGSVTGSYQLTGWGGGAESFEDAAKAIAGIKLTGRRADVVWWNRRSRKGTKGGAA